MTKPKWDIAADVRNDSSFSTDWVVEHLRRNGVLLTYGDVTMAVERALLDQIRKDVAAYTDEQRRRSMLSVDRALRKALPRVRDGKAKRKIMDNFYADLMLWTALKERGAS
jgi:hypothetical protein